VRQSWAAGGAYAPALSMKNLLLLTLLKFYDILFIYKRRELFYISVEYKENIIDTGMTLYDANK
jgi:hypothetical protein